MSRKFASRVLIIEDDKDWQDILRKYLEPEGFRIEIVDSLQEGLKRIEKEMYHVVTIDLQLDEDTLDPSEFEGWKILERIIKLRADQYLTTVVITGFDLEYKKLSNIKKTSATFFMPKRSFDKQTFVDKVKRSVDYRDIHFYQDKKD